MQLSAQEKMGNCSGFTRPDFPFHNRQPIPISALQWLFILSALCAAFALPVMPWPSSDSIVGRWAHALLFCLVPLGATVPVAHACGHLPLGAAVDPRNIKLKSSVC